MRNIPSAFLDHLSGSCTTICRAWKITRGDGIVLGYTEHDKSFQIAGQSYQPMSGLDASVAQASLGLASNSVEVLGALTSNTISELDIRADKYDGARVDVFVVNWSNPNEYLLENTYSIGEITEEDGLFKAELRTLESDLDQTQGEYFIKQCQANLGDIRCKVLLNNAVNTGNGIVSEYDQKRLLIASGLGHFSSNWFEGGKLTWTSGANTGSEIEVTQHLKMATSTHLQIWKHAPYLIDIGDTFEITAGCDKEFDTCKKKFSNELNFRGFPHLPGTDFAVSYAGNTTNNDGGIIVK